MNPQDIKQIFNSEFSFITDKFVIIEEILPNLKNSTKDYIYHPGVYIFLFDSKVIKVGRHLTNSRKRALEHIKAETQKDDFNMKSLENNPNCKVILINLKSIEDYHWAASLEIFLEKKLNPQIKSKRQG